MASRPGGREQAAEMLFQWGQERRQEKTSESESKGEAVKALLPKFFLEEILARYPHSEKADNAALLLVEQGFCRKWEAFPDCPAEEIRQYEKFLNAYPTSDRRPYALLETARRYQALAERYGETEKPWHHAARAELCAAMAQSLWMQIVEKYPTSLEAGEAQTRLAQIPPDRKPALPIPPSGFEF